MSDDQDAAPPQYKVFVGGLTWDLTNEQLQDEFKTYAATKAEIMVDKMSGRSRGFGFVWFERRQDMEEAIAGKNKGMIKDREISVKEAIPEDKIPPGSRQRDRYRGAPRGGYGGDRGYGGGYERGYDRGGYGGGYGGGYERGYGGGYERGGYGGYGGNDSYGYGAYGAGYDSRGGYADRSAGYGGYVAGGGYGDRSAGYGSYGYGPERSASRGPAAPRADPYRR